MKIALFYFSGTGNTEYACSKFKNYMDLHNNNVTLYKIEDTSFDIRIFNQADVIGIAYPICGANLPRIVNDFLDSLSDNLHKNVFIISTVGYINAYGPFLIEKKLKQKSLFLKWHYVYKTIDNTSIAKAARIQLELKHKKQENKFIRFCESIISNKPYRNGIGPWLLGGYLVRNLVKKQIENHYKTLYVDANLCIKCNFCINNCPTKSIQNNNEAFVFNETCTTCYRCINNCPVNAIKKISLKAADKKLNNKV